MKGNLYEGCEEKINDRDIKGANKPGFDELTTDHFVTLSSIWKGGGNTKEHSTSIIRALVKKIVRALLTA